MNQSRAATINKLLKQLGLDDIGDPETLGLIDRALTHVSAGLHQNHERLEFLGDAVLRLAATEFIDQEHPGLSVGACSTLRAQLVSDRWLADLGKDIGLEPLLTLGAKAQGDQAGRDTLLADATEALIGALYAGQGRLEPVHRWLKPYWQRTSAAVLEAPHRFNGKSLLQEWTQGQGLGLPAYNTQEQARRHGNPERFHSSVSVAGKIVGEGHGRSRKEAEQQAAAAAVQRLDEREAPH